MFLFMLLMWCVVLALLAHVLIILPVVLIVKFLERSVRRLRARLASSLPEKRQRQSVVKHNDEARKREGQADHLVQPPVIKERTQLGAVPNNTDGPNNGALATRQLQSPASMFPSVFFQNVVLDSRGNTAHTEIDEIIISPYGIFCIEEKNHVGIIFGSEKQKWWTQCRYTDRQRLYNPLHQNYKHVRALEDLLGTQVKASIHSYVVFLQATSVRVESSYVFSSREAMMRAVERHTRQVYTLEEYEAILKTLAAASSRSEALMPIHIAEVNAYLQHSSIA